MTQRMETGNKIQPLTNVAKAVVLAKELQNAPMGFPKMGVFFGPPGYGKTFSAMHLATKLDAIHISVQKLWNKSTLLKQLCNELGIMPKGALADLNMLICEHLARENRILIIDEADYAISRGLIEIIRDFHDGADIPIILVGMEGLPQKLRRWELIDGRVLEWIAAEPASLNDARYLANIYASGVEISNDLLQHILDRHTGNVRKTSKDIAYVKQKCIAMHVKQISRSEWGDTPFPRTEPPAPRSGLK